MAVTRLGKCYWGWAEVAAVLKGIVKPSAAPQAREALTGELRKLGYDAPLHLTSQASLGLRLALEEMRAQKPAKSVVVVPAYCCPSVPDTVRALGLTLRAAPVRADLNLDFDALEPLIKPDVLAVVGVHMYGLPIDIQRLKALAQKADAYVIDDAAHVVGLRGSKLLGLAGDAGLLSFQQSKTLTGGSPNGGGALLVTNETLTAGIAQRFASLPEGRSILRYYAWFAARHAIEITPRALTEYAYPFDDSIGRWLGVDKKKAERMSAAAGLAVIAQTARLKTIVDSRLKLVADYLDILKTTPSLDLAQTTTPQSLTRVVVRWQGTRQATDVREKLLRQGITTRLSYPLWTAANDPTASTISKIVATHLELPASPELTRGQQEIVVHTLAAELAKAA